MCCPEDGHDNRQEKVISVGLGRLEISEDAADVLVAMGIGSTLAIAAYDPIQMVGGLLHAMLPHNSYANQVATKFVDSGIAELRDRLVAIGADEESLVWRFTGGAQLLTSPSTDSRASIARQNVLAAQEVAARSHLNLIACETGGHKARTAFLYLRDGRLRIHDSDGHDHDYPVTDVASETSGSEA